MATVTDRCEGIRERAQGKFFEARRAQFPDNVRADLRRYGDARATPYSNTDPTGTSGFLRKPEPAERTRMKLLATQMSEGVGDVSANL